MVQSFKLALKDIWSSKMWAFLTTLGIIIGMAPVIILVGLVSAYISYMAESFVSLGTSQVMVSMMNMSSRSVSVDEMYEFFEENADTFDHMTSWITVSTAMKHGSDTVSSTGVTGVNEDYLSIEDYRFQEGRNTQYFNIVSRQKICVVEYYVATELYGNPEKTIDQTVKIDDCAYRVVDVVGRQDEESQKDRGIDDLLWTSCSCAMKMSRNVNINNYTFAIQNLEKASETTELISDFLMETFKNEGLFNVTATGEMLGSLNSMIATVSTGLGGITGVPLLMTGVDVTNIMLVSVTERTRGVGIRKALGTERGVILQQFIVEAAVQDSLGGILEVILGSIATTAVGSLTGLNASPMPSVMIISFGVSVAIGLLFGYTPARRAAGLNPIDTLRSE